MKHSHFDKIFPPFSMEKLDYLVLVNSDDSDILEFLEFLF